MGERFGGIKEMIDMICYTLKQKFPDAVIYRGQAGGTEGPAFYVAGIETSQEKTIGNLYTKICKFIIRYHPGADNSGYEGLEVIAQSLYPVMEYMKKDGAVLCGYGMKHRIEDNVLQFFLTCKENLKRELNEPLMEELKTNFGKRG